MKAPEFTLSFFARLHDVTIMHGIGLTELNTLGAIAMISEKRRLSGKPAEVSRADLIAAMPVDERTIDKAISRVRSRNLIQTRRENQKKAWHRLAPGLLKMKGAES
ncbi:MAG: hypothetical protein RLZZ341_2445 [Pseudomonadota bacterium]|jgi:hypothetical protein